MDIAGLQAVVADLKTSVDALVALPSNPAPVDLQPVADQLLAIKASVDARVAAG